jgi:hypothetical protein
MSINDRYRYIEELGIWVHHELSTYDKKMITRARNKLIKANTTAGAANNTDGAANNTANNTPAESVVYMMTESGEMVPAPVK